MNRREFIHHQLGTAGALCLFPSLWSCSKAVPSKELKILVLGGTQFVGPAIVNALLDQGHKPTLLIAASPIPGYFPNFRISRETDPKARKPIEHLQKAIGM